MQDADTNPDRAVAGALHRMPGFGRRLRRLRVLRGLKQSALADMLGVTQATVSRWEAGVLVPADATAARLLAIVAPWTGLEDTALRRLVESSGAAVHLITEADHRLLAASATREREWGRSAADLRGCSHWRFATDGIMAVEAGLAELGWWDRALPAPVAVRTEAGRRGLRIRPGTMVWERLYLADGTPVRLCTSDVGHTAA